MSWYSLGWLVGLTFPFLAFFCLGRTCFSGKVIQICKLKFYGDSSYLVRCCPNEEKYWIESGGGLRGGRHLKMLFYSKPYLHLLPLSVLPSWLLNHKNSHKDFWETVSVFGETQPKVTIGRGWSTWQCLVDLWHCRFMVLWNPTTTLIAASCGAAHALWCRRRKRLPAPDVGPSPVYHSSLFRHHPQVMEKPVSLLLSKVVQGSCTLFSS